MIKMCVCALCVLCCVVFETKLALRICRTCVSRVTDVISVHLCVSSTQQILLYCILLYLEQHILYHVFESVSSCVTSKRVMYRFTITFRASLVIQLGLVLH